MRRFAERWVLLGLVLAVPATAQVGEVRFDNSGALAAQASFHRGLALLHSFEYAAAAAAFREAQKADASFALAYWGEAMTYNHPVWFEQDLEAARRVLERLGPTPAARLAKAPTTREQDWLRAVEVLYGTGSKESRDSAYARAMRSIYEKYPGDPEAESFYALALLGTTHAGRDVPVYMRAAAVVEETFRAHPQHPGAAHYLIHSYDDPVHAPLGLRAARAYSAIAPDAAHAQHMTSHIFVAMGMWTDVITANENAMRVQNAMRKAAGQPPTLCGHYPFWLQYGYTMQGRITDAKRILSDCRATVAGTAEGGHAGAHGGPAAAPTPNAIAYAQQVARFLIDTEDWTGDVAAWPHPANLPPAAQITLAYLDGYRAWQQGNVAATRTAQQRLAAARQAAAGALAADNAASARAAILDQQLTALIALQDARQADAVRLLQEAARTEEAMPFEFGPPFIDKPTRELLGDVLLRLGRNAEAKAAFDAALARAPLRTNSIEGQRRATARLNGGEDRSSPRAP
jgi:tetratricopeptide (TPR) repeat protein